MKEGRFGIGSLSNRDVLYFSELSKNSHFTLLPGSVSHLQGGPPLEGVTALEAFSS